MVVVLVLALVGVGAFALTRDGGAAGPSPSGGGSAELTDADLEAMIAAEADRQVIENERANAQSGLPPGSAEDMRKIRDLLVADMRENLLPTMRYAAKQGAAGREAAERARRVLSESRRR